VHRHRYHGVLAPNATLRPQVVGFGRPERRAEAPEPDDEAAAPRLLPEPGPAPASPERIRWAVLLARIYEVLPPPVPGAWRPDEDPRVPPAARLVQPPRVSDFPPALTPFGALQENHRLRGFGSAPRDSMSSE